MDSITQATMGAVVGELVLGRQIGWRGAAWGALWGTVPDLDILAYPFFDSTERLSWHRGISHSILLTLLMTPVSAASVRLGRREPPSWPSALVFGLLVWTTHIALDCFNAYGTQIFEPFSSYRVSLDWLFIIDPLFTGPMLLALLALPFLRKLPRWRFGVVAGGTALSALALLWAIVAHQWGMAKWQTQLSAQGHREVAELRCLPTPFNTVYRRCLARVEGGFLIGYLSLFDGDEPIAIRFVPDGHELLTAKLRASPAVEAVAHFSEGWWLVDDRRGHLELADLRFFDAWMGVPGREAYADRQGWRYRVLDEGTALCRAPRDIERPGDVLTFIWRRMWGLAGRSD